MDRSRSRSQSPATSKPRRSRSPPPAAPPSHGNGRRMSRSRSRSRSPARRRKYSRSPPPRSRNFRRRDVDDHRRENPEPSLCLGVFGLNYRTTEQELTDLFSKYGTLDKVHLVFDKRINQSRGFGFVYFDSVESSTKAREATNGMDFDGRQIRVDFSVTQKAHEPTPGFYAGRPVVRRSRSPPRRRRYSRSRSRSQPPRRRYYSRSRSRSRSRGGRRY